MDIRRRRPKLAEAFLPEVDTLSTTDVVHKFSALNEEIFQAADLLGAMLQSTERTDRTQEQVTEAFEKARWMLGEQMASILGTESMNVYTNLDLKPLLVQIVLQIVVVSSWKPSDTTIANFLAIIYSEIRQVGKWSSKHLVNANN